MKSVKLTNALLQNYSQGGYVLVDDAAGVERRGLIARIDIKEDGKLWTTFTWLFESKGGGKWFPIARGNYALYLEGYNVYANGPYIYLLSPIRSMGITLTPPEQWAENRSYFEKILRSIEGTP